MNMLCLSLSMPGGYNRFSLGGRDTLRKIGPHDIKRSSMLASYMNFTGYVMGIYFGVLHSGLFRKMNLDNVVCYMLTLT